MTQQVPQILTESPTMDHNMFLHFAAYRASQSAGLTQRYAPIRRAVDSQGPEIR